ncbi:sensor histidine kinase [Chamaesiphon sp.]|uniref:sensor histidine kinase n=1 Tax=Chamaesiphon sp. TaxID=2814140 RepID=UPI00359436F1
MFLAIFIAAISGLLVGASAGYIWHEAYVRRQLRQVLDVLETSEDRENISLPLISQLRRRAIFSQQQQQQLEQQLFSWQSLIELAPIGYLQIDAENQVLCCNQSAQHLLQIQKWHSGQTKLLLELVRSYELDRLITKTRSTQVAKELVWQFHFGYPQAANSRSRSVSSGESIWLKASSMPLADGAIGIFIESQQEQVDGTTARERWLGDLAHEIRTPLTVIHLLAETLQSKVTPDLTRWVNKIIRETDRLIDLVQHFLELSQLEFSTTQHLQLAQVDFVRLINDVWYTLEPIARQRQVEFVYTGPVQLLLEIDAARFTQAAINLFDNSLKYCPDRGHIWMDIHLLESPPTEDTRSTQPHHQVCIDLYDDGAGFTQTDLPYIFDRLYRGDVSRQRQPSSSNLAQTTGSGLGLAIVRQIVLAHQGTIVAKNHPTTGGAWFRIILGNRE